MADISKIFKYTHFINEQHKTVALISHLGVLVDKHSEELLERYDMPINKFRILRGLKMMYPQGVGVYKLNDFLIDRKADISRLVERMVHRGFVIRETDPANKSITQVIITPVGIKLVDEINASMREFIAPAAGLSDTEAKELNQMLGKMTDYFTQKENRGLR